ncbi:MAG: 2-C-methyl-D-erythritol 2,4-cyclodiphosphate synthase [Deltaproteobacteria bacterium]|nr:2-C-methyl-D-erythritol 2,4-cyclodiphosphate synthase [Deltaproteobacteria bacterium]
MILPWRTGLGYDVHQLVPGRPLVLGGVEIPYPRGLAGHSDADVLSHAVADALLGAAGLGDLGRHFPDSDPRYRGISSLWFLRNIREKISGLGWLVGNLDGVLVAQQPKLAEYLGSMQVILGEALEVPPDRINVKATTTEGLGFAGREEGIAAYAVVLLVKREGEHGPASL